MSGVIHIKKKVSILWKCQLYVYFKINWCCC